MAPTCDLDRILSAIATVETVSARLFKEESIRQREHIELSVSVTD